MLSKMIICALSFALLCSCASIEGTRNKSYTHKYLGPYKDMNTLAIVPIEETSKFPLLPDMIEDNVSSELKLRYPTLKLISSGELGNLLNDKKKLEEFSSWYTSYKSLKFFDANKLMAIMNNSDVDFILSIRSLSVEREKIRGVDTGYSGMVSDANNVLRTNLKFIGELIDTKQGKIVWQGVGFSENINSPRRDLDLFFVIKHEKSPEVEAFLGEIVAVAAKGFVTEMAKSN